jgi:hypothetical protein
VIKNQRAIFTEILPNPLNSETYPKSMLNVKKQVGAVYHQRVFAKPEIVHRHLDLVQQQQLLLAVEQLR